MSLKRRLDDELMQHKRIKVISGILGLDRPDSTRFTGIREIVKNILWTRIRCLIDSNAFGSIMSIDSVQWTLFRETLDDNGV